LSSQQGGVESWQRALLSAERGLRVLDVPGLKQAPGLGLRVGIHYSGLGQVHLVARSKDMLSDCQGQHISLPQCSTVLPKALFQGSLWALVTFGLFVTNAHDVTSAKLDDPWNSTLGSTLEH